MRHKGTGLISISTTQLTLSKQLVSELFVLTSGEVSKEGALMRQKT